MPETQIVSILQQIQSSLKVPKTERNNFAGYSYRNIESILERAKELAKPFGAAITLSDELVMIGDRYYVRATCTLTAGGASISATAYAREAESRKGMDPGQLTGACSSYARKYAAQGLLAISGEADLDALPPAKEQTWPEGKFDATCKHCGNVGHNLSSATAETFRCPKCGAIDWKPIEGPATPPPSRRIAGEAA